MGALAVVLITAAPVAADAYQVPAPPSPTASCDVISPVAIPCVALGKFADAVAAECRRVGVPDARCVLPLAHRVTQAARDAYLQSWVHRTARFQDALQDPVPLRETQWLGTHNSFNSLSDSFTVSHADSNQQLSLAQQLDIDVRALELDLHYLPRLEGHGAPGVTVCHGLGPKNANLGCTVEPLLATVLPQIANWLNAPGHTEEVILLYLEDQLKNASAYESVVATLDQVLRRADGTSLIYRPNPARRATNGCVPLPLDVSREEIRASGARAVLVGSCAPGWSAAVFDWSGVELESGSNSGYRPYPACDATYGRGVYAWRLVRYYEDSTLATALANPTRPPANPQALTPPKVQAMTDCGVNLFGFDQLLPEDGRIQASLWSWAPDEPRAGAGACALQGGWPLGRRIVRGPTPCGLSGRGRQVDRDAGTRGLRRGCPSLHSHRRGLYPAPNGQSERPSARRGRARRWRLGALPTAAMTSVVRPGRADPRIPARAQSGPR
ncbi:Conserved exported or envelope protein of uncharacterised function [Mycobacterium tuberculosis]|nr:Conserved exported or envelope protein of uncharacterised function [Mycobacterium tuberculosis]CKW20737.1 Conserved exported or envelope protein of uncharacterised function [Mycobacterium tuberculosis]CKX33132.1 Conserved exported or envelope protein of uncharacterised function [Mycobacterium tuberculosis]CKX33846.1 Conserved exported or envelope protein of uncharacterised function [Mycobacterium tuberculosis]CKX33920.1 Conserved exported or envelope protein of uncharacterised function [Myco